MPYSGEPIHDGTGFLWIGQGLVTGQELIDGGAGAVVRLQAHENITHMIADFTLATSFQVSVEEVMKVGEIDRRNLNSSQTSTSPSWCPRALGNTWPVSTGN